LLVSGGSHSQERRGGSRGEGEVVERGRGGEGEKRGGGNKRGGGETERGEAERGKAQRRGEAGRRGRGGGVGAGRESGQQQRFQTKLLIAKLQVTAFQYHLVVSKASRCSDD